eukprot:365256-Chlamydomonas_euryale.AAC.9
MGHALCAVPGEAYMHVQASQQCQQACGTSWAARRTRPHLRARQRHACSCASPTRRLQQRPPPLPASSKRHVHLPSSRRVSGRTQSGLHARGAHRRPTCVASCRAQSQRSRPKTCTAPAPCCRPAQVWGSRQLWGVLQQPPCCRPVQVWGLRQVRGVLQQPPCCRPVQ